MYLYETLQTSVLSYSVSLIFTLMLFMSIFVVEKGLETLTSIIAHCLIQLEN